MRQRVQNFPRIFISIVKVKKRCLIFPERSFVPNYIHVQKLIFSSASKNDEKNEKTEAITAGGPKKTSDLK
jgi:hypothetical protein